MARRMIRCVIGGLIVLGLGTGTVQAAGWADSLFSERAHDFGPVPRGAKVKHDFVLTNRLAEPITILNLRPSCGCTSGKASTSTVNPGASAVIEARMDTRNFLGTQGDDPLRDAGDRRWTRGGSTTRGHLEHPRRHRPEPRLDRLWHGDEGPDAQPGLCHRPDRSPGMEVRTHGLCQPRPRRNSRNPGGIPRER